MSSPTGFGRRRFLALAASATAGTAILAACTPQTVEVTRVVQQPVEVTKVVQQQVEVTKIVQQQVEVTKIVQQQVQVTPTPPPAIKGTVNVWAFPATEDDPNLLYKPLMEKFVAQNSFVTPKIDVLPWSGRREKMMTAYAAGTPPDVAYVNTDTLSQFGSNKVLQDLSKLIPANAWSDVPTNVANAGLSWKGAKIMYPCFLGCNTYVSNSDLLTSIGMDPKKKTFTWQDILDIGAAAKPKGLFAFNWLLVSWDSWISAVWQAGGTVYNADATKSLLDQAPCEETLTWLTKLFQGGFVPKEGAVSSEQEVDPSAVDYFITGKQVISGIHDSIIVNTLKEQAPKMKWAPVESLKNKTQAYDATAGCWGIFNKTKYLDAAAAWINFMITPENMGFQCSVSAEPPGRQAAYEFWVVDPMVKTLVNTELPSAMLNQDANMFWQEGKTTCAPYFQAAVLGKQSPKDALAQANTKLQKIMDDFWAKQTS